MKPKSIKLIEKEPPVLENWRKCLIFFLVEKHFTAFQKIATKTPYSVKTVDIFHFGINYRAKSEKQ